MMSGASCGGGYQTVNEAAVMEDERSWCDEEKVVDDVMLPGFRFHPTDEELVGFYLRRKIQHKPLSIELIKQLDIYKYDPWDLPKLATTGEKEWYFYCPRDRKYRNSARPNRVTSAGFWKATGTDRPIYSSEAPKCIGLKKSLVFYRGRAAKGIKTDWMMHEFRLPSSTTDSKSVIKPPVHSKIPPNDSWAICRIFKKTSSMAQRALAHSSWAARLPEPTNSAGVYYGGEIVPQATNEGRAAAAATSHLNVISNTQLPPPITSFCFSPTESCNPDMASILMSIPPSLVCGDQLGKTHSTIDFSQRESCDHTLHAVVNGEETCAKKNMVHDPEGDLGPWQEGSPFNVVVPSLLEAWKSNVQWEPMPCSSDVSGSSYISKCYT